jgi:hypothetical protein
MLHLRGGDTKRAARSYFRPFLRGFVQPESCARCSDTERRTSNLKLFLFSLIIDFPSMSEKLLLQEVQCFGRNLIRRQSQRSMR